MEFNNSEVGVHHIEYIDCENKKYLKDGFCNFCPGHFGEKIKCNGTVPYRTAITDIIICDPSKICQLTNGGKSDLVAISKKDIEDVLNGMTAEIYAYEKDANGKIIGKSKDPLFTLILADLIVEKAPEVVEDELPEEIEIEEHTSGIIGHVEHEEAKDDFFEEIEIDTNAEG